MKKTIAIVTALIIVVSACGTPSIEGEPAGLEPPGTQSAASPEPTAGDTRPVDDDSDGSTAAASQSETTVPATTSTTSRAASSSGDATGGVTTTTIEDEGDDTAGEAGVTGEVPTTLMDQVFAHAEGHTGQRASAMTVIRAEAVTWPDGSLGCPEPGMQYTQALVPGYWVEISVGDVVLDYRLSDRGGMKLCEGGGGVAPLPRDDT